MPSPYRDDFRIKAYTFGEGEPSLCVVGAMRGDELQQQYTASRLVALLAKAEREGRIAQGRSITVVPCVNPSSINVEKRFWPLDNTDINRMFPGYDRGETTQRIAAALFEFVNVYRFGVQLASFYLPGVFLPHIRLCRTGYEPVDEARLFGLPYVDVRDTQPFDTVLLNYNWQIWQTHAFSLYAGGTATIDCRLAQRTECAVLRFAQRTGLITHADDDPEATPPDSVQIIDDNRLVPLQAPHAGILLPACSPGLHVDEGQTMARITHPYEGRIVANLTAPVSGTVFFVRNHSITFQNTLIARICMD